MKKIVTKRELYDKLEDYYLNNTLYEEVLENATVSNIHTVNFHFARKDGQRNPVHRTVEFYVSKMLAGEVKSIKFTAENETLLDSVEQVLLWSGFSSNKQRDIRHLALFGNLFYKANCNGNKSWFDIIDSKNVTDYKEDSRGFITEIRIDTPVKNDVGILENRTEYWNKANNVWRIWQGNTNPETEIKNLGTPIQEGTITSLGINFVPLVHIKFKDAGYSDGLSSVYHVLSKIEEANRQAHRLHNIIFRYGKPTTVVTSIGEGANGEPLPPPLITEEQHVNGDSDLLAMPSKTDIRSLIPDIKYDSILAVLNAQMTEIENDLPELKYYQLTENNISGKALKMQMGAAIDKIEEARGNYLSGFIRIIQICLSLGSFWGLFTGIGSYDAGDFDFSVELPEVFPMDDSDKMELVNKATQAGMALSSALRLAGYSEEFIEQAISEQTTEQATKSQNDLKAFQQV